MSLRSTPVRPAAAARAVTRSARLLLFGAVLAAGPRAQTAPHLDGRVEADVAGGLLRGDVCVSGLEATRRWAFDLHRGLNVREVRAPDGRLLDHDFVSDPVRPGDATRYVAEDSVSAGGFCVAYVGAYPVYRVDDGERAGSDWKGQVAFDGRTVRAAEQTRFYPVPVDSASGAALDAVSYRLDVACDGCRSLYVNGSAPRPGPRATFASDVPRALLLYAGDFPFTTAGGVHFVGSDVSAADAALVQAGVRAVADAHAGYLGVPYGEEPAFLTFAAVSRTRVLGRTSWAFVTWPTVALDGRVPFSVLVDSAGGRRALAPETAGLMGHETAHYYFGTRYPPRGPLRGSSSSRRPSSWR